MESTDSSSSSQQPQLPPGFRFHPTDEELVVHYLKKKAASAPLPVTIIAEVDLYKFDPWELPGKATFGEQEWYFFSPRDRKYPNGARPNRAATSGYWKATGTDKPIMTAGGNQKVGVKKALVFYGGKPPKGIKTNWIMHEYRLADTGGTKPPPPGAVAADLSKKNSLRLDDWVLCRIYKKNSAGRLAERDRDDSVEEVPEGPQNQTAGQGQKFSSGNYAALLDSDNFLEGFLAEDGIQGGGSAPPTWEPSKQELSMASGQLQLPLKRALTTAPYWNPAKRFNSTDTPGGASMLSHLPQSAPFHHLGLPHPLSDGIFRQQYNLSGMNWNS